PHFVGHVERGRRRDLRSVRIAAARPHCTVWHHTAVDSPKPGSGCSFLAPRAGLDWKKCTLPPVSWQHEVFQEERRELGATMKRRFLIYGHCVLAHCPLAAPGSTGDGF